MIIFKNCDHKYYSELKKGYIDYYRRKLNKIIFEIKLGKSRRKSYFPKKYN
jgi:hypothetical protein